MGKVEMTTLKVVMAMTDLRVEMEMISSMEAEAMIGSKEKMAMTIQYHPEASPGPHDSDGSFETFVEMMKANKAAKKGKA